MCSVTINLICQNLNEINSDFHLIKLGMKKNIPTQVKVNQNKISGVV